MAEEVRIDIGAVPEDIRISYANDMQATVSPGFNSNGAVPASEGFFVGEGAPVKLHRVTDRLFVAGAASHTGRRTGDLGGSWLTERGANYFEKNAHFAVLSTQVGGRIALVAGTHVEVGASSLSSIGIVGVAVNEGEASYSRAGYFEAMHKGNAAVTGGLEVQVGNFTSTDPSPTPYSLGDGVYGHSVGAEAGYGYTVGNDNTPITAPTLPAAAAYVVASGSHQLSYQRFRAGFIFTNNSLFRGEDGLTGVASAIMLSQQHEIEWFVSDTNSGATIRSDVNSATSEVGMIFKNNSIHFTSQASEQEIFTATHVANAVNQFDIRPGATGASPGWYSVGDDTNIGQFYIMKGNGQGRFLSHGGSGSNLYIVPSANAPVNYLTIGGNVAGSPVNVGAGGTDTHVSIGHTPKGANGEIRLNGGSAAAKIRVSDTGVGFYGGAPAAKPTGVAVDAPGIHAALVALNLIAA